MNTATACVILAAALAAPGLASAQAGPAPEPGLWESTATMTLNGRDVMAEMRENQAAMLQRMPPERRAQFEAMMKRAGGDPAAARQHCLTPERVKAMLDPAGRLRDMQRQAPRCRFEPTTTTGSTVQFKGRCEDPDGFTGDVVGTLTMDGPKASTFVYTGKGQGRRGPMDMRVESRSRWVAASCGDVKPLN